MEKGKGAFQREPVEFKDNIAIIAISTHGVIIDGRPIIRLPSGIQVAKMNFVMPSVCSFIGEDAVLECNKVIKNEIDNTPGLERQNVFELCVNLTEKIRPLLQNTIKNADEYVKNINSGINTNIEDSQGSEMTNLSELEEEEDLMRRKAFIEGADKAFRIFSTANGITHMINKSYIRTESKDLDNDYGDWQMKLLNHPDQPDLIPDIYKFLGKIYTRGESRITLEEILLFLKFNGIKKIIIFDYSCSNITDDRIEDLANNERSRRKIAFITERDFALSRGTLGYGGKKSKRKFKSLKKKSRRYSKKR